MNIILGVDGSSHSIDAIKALAHFTPPEKLTLVHALSLPDLDHPMITPALRDKVVKEVEDQLRQEGERILERANAAVPSNCGLVERIQQIGSPAQVILETARSAHADVIMLGARGLGPLKELVLGSVSHRVVSHAPCATFVVKSAIPALRNILLPIEGEDDAERALKFLALHPFRELEVVHVMTVWPQPQLPWPVTMGQSKLLEEEALSQAQEKLDAIVRRLESMTYQAHGDVGLGSPAFAILEKARTLTPDLIVIGTHGRRGLSRFLIGSISHSILHQASCPVLVVR